MLFSKWYGFKNFISGYIASYFKGISSYLMMPSTWQNGNSMEAAVDMTNGIWSLVHFCLVAFPCMNMLLISGELFKLYLHVINSCVLYVLSTVRSCKNVCFTLNNRIYRFNNSKQITFVYFFWKTDAVHLWPKKVQVSPKGCLYWKNNGHVEVLECTCSIV